MFVDYTSTDYESHFMTAGVDHGLHLRSIFEVYQCEPPSARKIGLVGENAMADFRPPSRRNRNGD
jgi:hypothetical protein